MSDVEQAAKEEIDIDGNNRTVNNLSSGRYCFNLILKVTFSTPGLVVLVAFYSVMGALIFPLLEAPRELRNDVAIAKSREDCLRELWTITEKLNVLYKRNWTMLVHEQLRRFEGSIVAATRSGLEGNGPNGSKWSFSEALLYSVTVITTIGHGNLTPRTSGGKVVTIIYALIGVPLMLMCLSSLGGLLADALICTYTKLCCGSQRRRNENAKESGESREMDCNVCKYDTVCSETKFNGFEYITTNDREDACHLIRNSPIKSNHGSPCSTLKSKPIAKHQHQMNQQQYLTSSSEKSSPVKQLHQIQQHSPQHFQIMSQIHRSSLGCTNDTAALGIAMGTSTYFPLTTSSANFTCSAGSHYDTAPNIKYHGMQLQSQLSLNKSSTENPMHAGAHTATVHSIRRGKFLPKPMPQEINMLLAEGDMSYRHESPSSADSNTNSNSTVDIMEDEEEHEQNRMGCPHGTPSRVPLISSSTLGMASTSAKNNIMQLEDENQIRGADNEDCALSEANAPQVPITVILLILISYISIGTVIFSLWENWTIIDGAYFCFVTLSTIGYGDFLPKRTFRGPDIQLFACCAYLLLGLVLVAMSFSLLETQLLWKCKRIAVRLKLAKD